MGPLLFILYVNDFPNISLNLKTTLFADDTTVSIAGKDFLSLREELSSQLGKISQWSFSNKLSLNSSKTRALVFSNRSLDENLAGRVSIYDGGLDYSNAS